MTKANEENYRLQQEIALLKNQTATQVEGSTLQSPPFTPLKDPGSASKINTDSDPQSFTIDYQESILLKFEAIDTKLQSLSVDQQSGSKKLNDSDIFKFDIRYSLFLKILASFIFL